MGLWGGHLAGEGQVPRWALCGGDGGAEKGGIFGWKRQEHEGARGQGQQGSPGCPWWGAGVHGRAGGGA